MTTPEARYVWTEEWDYTLEIWNQSPHVHIIWKGGRPKIRTPEGMGTRVNIAYMCPKCGVLWCRKWYDKAGAFDGSTFEWRAEERNCLKHDGGNPLDSEDWGDGEFSLELCRYLLTYWERIANVRYGRYTSPWYPDSSPLVQQGISRGAFQ